VTINITALKKFATKRPNCKPILHSNKKQTNDDINSIPPFENLALAHARLALLLQHSSNLDRCPS